MQLSQPVPWDREPPVYDQRIIILFWLKDYRLDEEP